MIPVIESGFPDVVTIFSSEEKIVNIYRNYKFLD